MLARCTLCDSTGEIVVSGMTVNPFSGVPVHDPESEDIVPCPRCSRARDLDAPAGRMAA